MDDTAWDSDDDPEERQAELDRKERDNLDRIQKLLDKPLVGTTVSWYTTTVLLLGKEGPSTRMWVEWPNHEGQGRDLGHTRTLI